MPGSLAPKDTAERRQVTVEADRTAVQAARADLYPTTGRCAVCRNASLPNDGRYPTLELTPQQRRQKTLEALTAQVEVLSRSNPVLMIFEDVHWIDPTSLEVLGRTVDRLRTLGVLLIVTYRPEFEPPWIGRPYVTALSLNRLGEREIAAMIERVTGNKSLPEHQTRHYRANGWHSAVRRRNDEGSFGSPRRKGC